MRVHERKLFLYYSSVAMPSWGNRNGRGENGAEIIYCLSWKRPVANYRPLWLFGRDTWPLFTNSKMWKCLLRNWLPLFLTTNVSDGFALNLTPIWGHFSQKWYPATGLHQPGFIQNQRPKPEHPNTSRPFHHKTKKNMSLYGHNLEKSNSFRLPATNKDGRMVGHRGQYYCSVYKRSR